MIFRFCEKMQRKIYRFKIFGHCSQLRSKTFALRS